MKEKYWLNLNVFNLTLNVFSDILLIFLHLKVSNIYVILVTLMLITCNIVELISLMIEKKALILF